MNELRTPSVVDAFAQLCAISAELDQIDRSSGLRELGKAETVRWNLLAAKFRAIVGALRDLA